MEETLRKVLHERSSQIKVHKHTLLSTSSSLIPEPPGMCSVSSWRLGKELMVFLVKSPLSPVSCFLTFIVTVFGPVGAMQQSSKSRRHALGLWVRYIPNLLRAYTVSQKVFMNMSNSIQQKKMLHLNLHEITYLRAGRGSSVSGSELAMMEG